MRENTYYPLGTAEATPDYVLAVMRDANRHIGQFNRDVDPSRELTFDMTVEEWLEAFHVEEDPSLWRVMNNWWRIPCFEDEWETVLQPQKTLLELCEFIARRVVKEEIRPAQLLGTECMTAGAFLTVRSLLADVGEDVSRLRPSTPLEFYTRRHLDYLLACLLRLAPGRLPLVKYDYHPLDYLCGILTLSGYAALLSSWVFEHTDGHVTSNWFAISGFLLIIIGRVSSNVTSSLPLRRADFGELKTFGDLARCLAGEPTA
jgi:hypothetical protein